MQILPVDLTSLVAVILGISIVLIPVMGLTARFALQPVVTALAKVFDVRDSEETLRIIERRVELQEQEIDMLRQALRSLTEGREFERQLASTTSAAAEHAPLDPTDSGGS